MKKVFIIWLFCLSIAGFSQQKEYEKGKIIDTVLVDKNTNESFSLYLPKIYDPSKLNPVVFIFEPMARGKTGIFPFIKASEEYGYILICSNDSKNGPYDKNYEIANKLFNKVFSTFNIDEKRIYTSGFSGGSRLASSIAILTNQIQGVIACGAGFESKDGIVATRQNFSYAAIVGDRDMNYQEMINTKNFLNKFKVSNELFIFDIKHQWPTQDQILKAFDWLQLEAIEKNILPVENEQIKKIYTTFYNSAKQYQMDDEIVLTHDEYRRIMRNFRRYYNLDSIEYSMDELSKSKLYKTEKKLLESSFEKENSITKLFINQFSTDFDRSKLNQKWWRSKIAKLHKELDNANQTEKKMLSRLLYKVFAHAIETASIGNRVQNTNQSIICYEICIMIYPKYPLPYFKQIENYMDLHDEETALAYLEKLIESGYTDLNTIYENEAIDRLKKTNKYTELINKIK